MVYQICLMLMKNVPDAEDATQTVFRKAMEHEGLFRDPEHEKAWLFRVAINLSKNRLKANRRRSCEELPESLTCAMPEDLSFVWEAVSTLPIKYREVSTFTTRKK